MLTSRFVESVRSSSSNLSLRELLEQPVTELLGVGQDAAAALAGIGVNTIFDLGSSSVFAQASSALAAATSKLAMLASDVLDAAGSASPLSEVPDLPLENLNGISPASGAALSAALDAPTVRDFALWPPRRVAHDLVSVAAGTNLGYNVDETAEELRPALGEYPTERVYYDTLVMLGTEPPADQVPLARPLSLGQLAGASAAFGAPAIGAVATYSQSWFAQAVTLGHMVHSLALAPGEATRVAVIDWSRRTTATATDIIEERERLDNATNHSRAASEVQNAVANEMQFGGSISTGWAKSTSDASGFAGSIGGGIAGTIGEAAGALGFGFGGSSSSQTAETESRATSASWSVGSRSVMAGMTQRVNDRTEQHATSVRNRRATAVREVSQTEHEQVSTRIVANYNHMHALTVQYYEVVQIYRVTVQLNSFVRTLFLPFELLDFTGANASELVARFRGQLLDAALTQRAAQLLLDERGRVEVRSGVRVPLPISVGTLADANLSVTARMVRPGRGVGADLVAGGPGGPAVGSGPEVGTEGPVVASPLPGTRFTVVRPGPLAEVVPGDARLVSVGFEDVGIDRVRVDQAGVAAESSTFVVPAATDQVDFANGIPLRTVSSIHVARDASTQSVGSMNLRYDSEGRQSIAAVPLSLVSGTAMQKVAFLAGDAADRRAELLAHLQTNRSYYTQAVLTRLDSSSLMLMLSGVSWLGKPLADQVEPKLIAVTGNYLVLRAPAEDNDLSGIGNDTWGQLLRNRGVDFGTQDTRLVPIPTGGVFAEAVLGRSNSAEKLDITRFWNWQDSPIPLQPPEIAPVGTGSRATPEDLRPGQLGAPVVTVMPPSVLPEPTGLSAALGALAAANMFRDMSGLAGTQAAAQAAAGGTLTAATEAGRIASANYQAATTQATEMGKAAADMFKVLKTSSSGAGSSGGAPPNSGISGDGARVNLGRDLDARGVSANGRGGSAPAGPSAGVGRVSEGSTDVMPPAPDWTFSRERSYSDMAAGYSPDMVGAIGSALGVPVTPAGGVVDEVTADPTRAVRLLGPWLSLWEHPNNKFGRWPPAWFSRARRKESLVSDSPGISEPFWPLQLIENARSYDMNMDLYTARIVVFPSEGGATLDHRTLLERVRRDLNSFTPATSTFGNRLADFSPVDAEERAIWESQDARGAVIHVDAHGPDNFDLMCTAHFLDDDRAGWVFSTMTTDNAGQHPLSGAREFGIRRVEGGWEFYTQAVDRWQRALYSVFSGTGADIQHSLWTSLIDSFKKFVENRGGQVDIQPTIRRAVQWALVEPYLDRGRLEIQFGP
ncbi:hypothetical protein [Bradyrhizobium japonicum]|uniref:hypothetical protein n=1 Tax=Bradyrhizobium japonicum TaxID=375 RepID=UPI0004B442B7|nr:hypothetical protein [Bradyrhizobium japonicum]